MTQDKDMIIPVSEWFREHAQISAKDYRELYAESVEDPDRFWAEEASKFAWRATWHSVKNVNFDRAKGPVAIQWFEGGRLNLSENCLDRHLPQRADQTAVIWESDDAKDIRHITYQELFDEVCRFAHVLKSLGVEKGDRVTLYLPMIPEAAVAMLACARIGAVHSVVFAGFSAEALAGRIDDCGSQFVITADEGMRGGKAVALKANVDAALEMVNGVEKVVVVKRTGGTIAFNDSRDLWYHELMKDASGDCAPIIVEAEDPLFILYTSGSTGKPKGVLHTTGGYMVWAGKTFRDSFDYREGDIFWCTADVGWVTGHSYTLYGPLLNGATTLMFEGVPSWPDYGRSWEMVDRHRVTIFYTAPTAIRAMMGQGDEFVTRHSRGSLRVLGSVGEPINPEAWLWYFRVVGEKRCPIADTWWQTETGGHMITALPGAHAMKPGAAAFPFFGVEPVIVDPDNVPLSGAGEGRLCIRDSWPGQARTIYGDHARFEETYFSQVPGMYFTGDGARRDEDGYYWITGRVDDVLNISGHRLGTAEVESALVGHAHVVEAAVVGYPHDLKGQGIYCYVTLAEGTQGDEATVRALKNHVREVIGPIATPDVIHFTRELPKTRSGKIMRRILRKIAEGETENLGDISTLTNPGIVAELVKGRKA